jgi:membrane-associated phospholipid phosphatase
MIQVRRVNDRHAATTMFPIRADEKLCVSLGLPRNPRSRQVTTGATNRMSVETTTPAEYSRARADAERDAILAFPVLDKEPGRVGRRLATLPGAGHPVWTYVCGILIAFAVIASLSIAVGLLVTTVLLHVHGVAGDDESLVRYLAHHRSSGLTDASLVGSIMAGGVALPIIAGVAALVALVGKHWRLAAFLLFALAVESGSYRATALVVHRHRPEVHRLEKLPVDASYPSGHTAASIAVYCGIALLVTSRITNRTAQVAIWLVAALIPVFVAFSRMYRGMHHPLDVAGGVLIGIAALSSLVLVTRAAGKASR